MESTYFVVSGEFEDIGKLYFNRNGVWGEFSVFETVLAPNIKALNYHYQKWNKCDIEEDAGAKVEKISINVVFEDVIK